MFRPVTLRLLALSMLMAGCSVQRREIGYSELKSTPDREVLLKYGLNERYIRSYLDSALLENPNTPPEVLAAVNDRCSLRARYDVKKRVAAHPNTSTETLLALAKDKDQYISEAVLKSPRLFDDPTLLLGLCEDDVFQYSLFDRLKTEGLGILSPSALQALKASPVRPRVLVLEDTPEGMAELAAHPNSYYRRIAAGSSRTPADLLSRLATDRDESVVRQVGSNPNTPKETLLRLAASDDAITAMNLAENPNTPTEALDLLASHKKQSVLERVAKNPSVTEAILLKLVDSDCPRYSLIDSPHVTDRVLEAMIRRGIDQYDVQRLLKYPKIDEPVLLCMAGASDKKAREALAGQNARTLPGSVYVKLSRDPEWTVREDAAGNPGAPAAVLEVLAKDSSHCVRRAVALNPSTSPAIIAQLQKDEEALVREGAYKDLIAKIKTARPNEFDEFARHPDSVIRGAVAKSVSAPSEVVNGLANDPDRVVRLLVARNRWKTSDETLIHLTQDSDQWVREAALATITKKLNDQMEQALRTRQRQQDEAFAKEFKAGFKASLDRDPKLAEAICSNLGYATVDELYNSITDRKSAEELMAKMQSMVERLGQENR